MIPSVNACFYLMDRYEMLDNIKAHSIIVTKVARIISRELMESGFAISFEKVTAGALLHDIGKTSALKSGGDHSEIGRRICLDNNLEEIAEIVAEHVILKDDCNNNRFSEEMIVYYSDKRVNHDKIVSLDQRLKYILRRYGRDDEVVCRAIMNNFERCRRIEKRIFRQLSFGPQEISLLAEDEFVKVD